MKDILIAAAVIGVLLYMTKSNAMAQVPTAPALPPVPTAPPIPGRIILSGGYQTPSQSTQLATGPQSPTVYLAQTRNGVTSYFPLTATGQVSARANAGPQPGDYVEKTVSGTTVYYQVGANGSLMRGTTTAPVASPPPSTSGGIAGGAGTGGLPLGGSVVPGRSPVLAPVSPLLVY